MVKKNVENYENLSDEEIIERINSGRYELLPVMIERYLPTILFFVGQYCAPNRREDAVQEATFALYSAMKNYDPARSSFSTFAGICIKRSVLGSVKSTKRKKDIPDELVSPLHEVEIADRRDPEEIFLEKESLQDLTELIRLELSGLEYRVLQRYLEGKSYSSIAKELNITEKSVENSLARIRKKLG